MASYSAISDSIIETADDAIVLKAIARDGQPARPVENVTYQLRAASSDVRHNRSLMIVLRSSSVQADTECSVASAVKVNPGSRRINRSA